MEDNNFNNQPREEIPQNDIPPHDENRMSDQGSEEKSTGGIIGAVIVVIIVVLGGLYFWGSALEERDNTAEIILSEPDPQTEQLQELGASDEVSAIEDDLDATNLEEMDRELEQMESEMGF